MGLEVERRIEGRHDLRLAAMPDGWVSARPRELARWSSAGEQLGSVMLDEECAGPLVHPSDGAGVVSLGPVLLDGDAPRWTVRDIASQALAEVTPVDPALYRLVIGAASPDGLALVVLRRPESRVRGAGNLSKPLVVAVVDPAQGSVVEAVEGPEPSEVLWAGGMLALGRAGQVDVRTDDGQWTSHDLGEYTSPRSFAVDAGALWAGLADGRVVRVADGGVQQAWSAHERPVTAIAVGGGRVATGGDDGLVRLWATDGVPVGELDAAADVPAVCLLPDGRVVAKVGAADGSLLVLRA